MPLLRCSPSQFWLTRHLRRPRFCSSTRAMCDGVGSAFSVSTAGCVRCLPCAASVQWPSGPRKSGIPVPVSGQAGKSFGGWGRRKLVMAWLTGRSRDTGTGEGDQVSAVADRIGDELGFAIKGRRRLEALLFGHLGGRKGHFEPRCAECRCAAVQHMQSSTVTLDSTDHVSKTQGGVAITCLWRSLMYPGGIAGNGSCPFQYSRLLRER